ncbi:MAG: hypothetical protein MZV63_40895 [Marinilabiliales bacterium]|nr:hypothetical protein [Marinilabiliales bacterium]
MDLASSFPLFYRYDESRTSSGWVAYATGTLPLNPMEGYAVNFGATALPWTVDVTGVVNNGSLSVTLYNHGNTYTDGFNLVGNPYPHQSDGVSRAGQRPILTMRSIISGQVTQTSTVVHTAALLTGYRAMVLPVTPSPQCRGSLCTFPPEPSLSRVHWVLQTVSG